MMDTKIMRECASELFTIADGNAEIAGILKDAAKEIERLREECDNHLREIKIITELAAARTKERDDARKPTRYDHPQDAHQDEAD